MRLLLVAVGFVVVFATPSQADPQPAYPVSDVDRPQLLLPGMTSLDLGLDFPTFSTASVDANGNQVRSTTSLGEYRDLDVVVTHAVGSVQLSGRLLGEPNGATLAANASTYLGSFPGVLELAAEIEAPNNGSTLDHNYGQSVAYHYKHHAVPRLLAILATVRVSASEWAITPVGGMTTNAHDIYGSAGVAADIQLLPDLALFASTGVTVPFESSSNITTYAPFFAGTQLQYTIGHWDLYGALQLDDVTRSRHPYAGFGGVHRWGG